MSHPNKRSVMLLLAALLGLAAPVFASDVTDDHGTAIAQEAALDRLEAHSTGSPGKDNGSIA